MQVRRTHVVAALVALLALAGGAAKAGAPPLRSSGVVHAPFAARAAAESSTNWAGYAVTSASAAAPMSFTSVTGTWKQAVATCSAGDANAASAIWVGLGGYSETSQALEQIGTDADCSSNGPPAYYAWYELVPEPPVNLTLKIKPGDTITTSVNVSAGNVVTLQLKNRTRGTVFTKKVFQNTPDLSSAEWIAEAPSSCSGFNCNPLPLANFGSVLVSKIATIGNGHGGTLTDPAWTAIPIQLVPGSRDRGFFPGPDRGSIRYSSTAGTSLPTALDPDGRAFTISWTANATSSG